MIVAQLAAVVLVGYLLGSIPFGVIVGRRSSRVDVRDFGSGKTGATNVLRIAGKKAAAAAMFLDLVKGALAVLFAVLLFPEETPVAAYGGWNLVNGARALAALSAMAGHKWPVFLRFRGGRGVATYFGGLLVLSPPAGLFGGEIVFLGAILTRYVSLGSISGAVAALAILFPLTLIYGSPIEYLLYALIGALFIIVTHRDNITRLWNGKERKIGEKAEMSGHAAPPHS